MIPGSFSDDKKTLWGRIVTLGWLIRLRAWNRDAPLGNYSSGSNSERRVVPLMFQLTGRPLLDLITDFFRGPELFQQASRYATADCIRESYRELRQALLDLNDEDMSVDFHQLIRWCSKKDLSFNRDTLSFQSSFLQKGWDFHLVGRECSLAYQTFHPDNFGVTKVICHHVGGSLGPLGYVSTCQPKKTLGAFLKTGGSIPPLTDTKSAKVYIYPLSIDLCAAVMAVRPWDDELGRRCGRFMRGLETRLGLDSRSRYECYRELYKEFVFWHEYGHLHYGELEKKFCRAAIEAAFNNRFYSFWIELLADAFAFERVLDNADELRRYTMMALIMDGCEPEALSPTYVIAVRSLLEPNPSLYVHEVGFEMLRQLDSAGKELKRRALQVSMSPKNIHWSGWVKEQEEDLLGKFFEWQQTLLKRALKELMEVMAEN